MNKAAQAYFQTKVGTTDQGQLLLMLYDGALNYLKQARDKMLAKDFAGKGILLSKVIDIVSELSSSLNMEKGGSLAVNLNNLYILCTARLLQANLKMNVESLDSVVHILSGLRSAYAQILENPEARQATAEIADRMQPTGSVIKTAQPIMQGVAAPVPRGRAQALYGKNAMPGTQPVQAQAAPPASAQPIQAPAQALNQAPAQAPVQPQAQAAVQPAAHAPAAQPASAAPAPAAPAAPVAQAATTALDAQHRAKVQAFTPPPVTAAPAAAAPPVAPAAPPAARRLPGAYAGLTPPGRS